MSPLRILRLPQVLAITGYSKSTVRRLELAGLFPRRVQIGENSVGWYADEVERYLVALWPCGLVALPRRQLAGAEDELRAGAGP